MWYSLVLVGVVGLGNGYGEMREDRYYFDLILRELWRYPILKQTLIRHCRKELDKCKSNGILRSYRRMIHQKELRKILDYLIECFSQRKTCRDEEEWQPWSEWSSCSVTCGTGRMIRTRSCKPDRPCLNDFNSIEATKCYVKSCPTALSTANFIFIFLFPLLFTLVAVPLCVFYYFYEFDFKLHRVMICVSSVCHRCCEKNDEK